MTRCRETASETPKRPLPMLHDLARKFLGQTTCRRLRTRMRERTCSGAVSIALILAAVCPANAQSEGAVSRAESLFEDARKLLMQARYAEACPKFAESHRLEPALGTLLNLAACHEKLGKNATAASEYRTAAAMARQRGEPERERAALDRVEALQPLLSTLTVTVPWAQTEATTLVVTVDGSRLAQSSWGLPVPVDPGSHVVDAQVPGKSRWVGHGVVGPVADHQVLAVPLFHPKAEPKHSSLAPASDATSSPRTDGGRTWGYVTGAAGVAFLIASGVAGLEARRHWGIRNDHCSGGARCDGEGEEAWKSAVTEARVANVLAGIGVVGLTSGIFLLLRPRASHEPKGAQAVHAGFFVNGNGAWTTIEGPISIF